MRVPSSCKTCAGRNTDWAWRIGVGEARTARRKRIEIGRLNDWMAGASHSPRLMLVGHDHKEIRPGHVASSLFGSDFKMIQYLVKDFQVFVRQTFTQPRLPCARNRKGFFKDRPSFIRQTENLDPVVFGIRP